MTRSAFANREDHERPTARLTLITVVAVYALRMGIVRAQSPDSIWKPYDAHQMDVVYAHNDPMAEAVIVAAQNAKLDVDRILFVGIDALPTAEGGIMSVLQRRLGITYIYPTCGKQAIEWAIQILIHHVNPPHKIALSFSEVRDDNAQSICNVYHCPQATPQP